MAREVRRTACNRDCPDACEILATWDGDRLVRLQGAPDHPVTRGFLCERTSRFLQRQYAPDRLKQPWMREGQAWRAIGWEEAWSRIVPTMRAIREESGGAALLHYRSGGSLGLMKHVTDAFFEHWGPVTEKSGDICSGAGEAAQLADFGACDSNDLFDLRHSRTIVLWGKNVYASSVHLLPILRDARARGARIVLIDPVHQRSASLADIVLQPRPGGDAALACGVARWMFDRQQWDPDAATYCDHWADYRDLILSQTVTEWAMASDVNVSQLEVLAACYAQGPAAILVGWGLQRRTHGALTVRALDGLATVAGNIGIAGGGVSFYFRRRGAFDCSFRRDESARTIPEPLLGEGILAMRDPPIRMVWVTAGNPVVMLPNSRRVAEALQTRELTVVVDAFWTDTARCADLVLPTTTFLEEDDLIGSYGHHWLANMESVAPPPAGVLTDYQLVQHMARAFDLDPIFQEPVEAWKRRLLARVESHGVTLESLRQGAIRNPLAQRVLFADRKFPTATGRVQLITELPRELRAPRTERPLMLAPLATARAQCSQWAPEEQQGFAVATVHPHRAAGIVDGEIVDLVSELGRLRVQLRFDPQQRTDVIVMDKGGWLSAGRCANAIIPARLTDAGEGAVYYDTPVVIERVSDTTD